MTVTVTASRIIVMHHGDFADSDWDQAMQAHGIWHEQAHLVDYGIAEGNVHVWTFERI